jgi:Flp pilus assembly protein TadD
MSLINNMLKDLESRELREAYDQDKLLGDVKVKGSKRQSSRWLLPAIVLLLLLIAAIVVLLYFSYQPGKTAETAAPVVAPVTQEPVDPVVRANQISAISSRSAESGEQLVVTLQGRAAGVVLRQSGPDSSLVLKQIVVPEEFSLSAAVLAAFPGMAIDSNEKETAILLPLAKGESLQLLDGGSRDNQQLIVTRTYTKPVKSVVQKKQPKQKPQQNQARPAVPVATVSAQPEEEATPEVALPVIKQRSALTATERAEQHYDSAYVALQEGRLDQAAEQLRKSIGLNPTAEAYLALAGIMIQEGNNNDARQLLQQGHRQLAGSADIAYLYARLLIDSAQLQEAQKVLAGSMAEGRNDGEYLALFGTVSRQLGHNTMAAQAYAEALNLQPQQSIWWMGLGLALDDNQQTAQALEAYYKALAIGLGDSLDTYVMKRVQELEGEQ